MTAHFKLRPYQIDAIEQIKICYLNGKKKCLLIMPTGAGKTTVFSEILKRVKGKSLMVVSGRKLVQQASDRLTSENVLHGVIMNGHKLNQPHHFIQICSIDTLSSRELFPDADFIVIDEAHLATSPKFKKFLAHYDCHLLSVTATPFSSSSLLHICDSVVEPVTIDELVEQGFLVPPIYYSLAVPNLEGVRRQKKEFGYEYSTKDLYDRMCGITGNIITNYLKFGESRPSILFAVNIAHSKQLAQEFINHGIQASHLDSDCSDEIRLTTINALISGQIKVICNVGILCTGVDIPSVSCIILARPTLSVSLYIQQVGRGTRPFSNKKDFIVLDHGGNVLRHGFINEKREINLKKQSYERKTMLTYWTCESCYLVNTGSQCRVCGKQVIVVQERKKLTHTEELLERIEKSPDVMSIALQEYRKLQFIARKNGLQRGWLYFRIKKVFGAEVANKLVYGKNK